ncbi:T9SS type A sorting domain-containing protein, partial [Candidatus Neomarinimicrobiota bacterium]
NQLTGSIPPELGNLAQLDYMNLHDNHLSGPIPPELGNLSSLQWLRLHLNQLSGPIPIALADLDSLKFLALSGNLLTGSIPPELANLHNLIDLYLNQNLLTGTIPPELGNLSNLTDLGLHMNQLTGAVPDEINQLTHLRYLCLHINQLSHLPSLDSLSALDWFWVYHNNFTFDDIEPNISLAESNFLYSPQDSIGLQMDTLLALGDTILLSVNVGGTANLYQWLKDGIAIPGATSDTLLLGPVEPADIGTYVCRIRNTIATDLTLYSRPAHISIEGYQSTANRFTLPVAYAIHPAFPNPFNMVTTISYDLPAAESVRLVIWDLLGREVIRLVDGYMEPGFHRVQWNGTDAFGVPCPSGIYIARLGTLNHQQSIKLILLK